MAGKKTTNIPLPDGTSVTIPSWASESTMEQVVAYMSAANKVDQKFLTLMKGVGADVENLQKHISALVGEVKKNADNVDKNNDSDVDLAKGVKGAAQAVVKASKFFGDTKAPLTGMTNVASTLAETLRDASPNFINRLGDFGGAVQAAGVAADVLVDAGLAYLGWNAAKLEQFAAAQQKVIDAGAIFYSSGEQFDMLYSSSIDAGVTYNSMIDAVSQFGGAIVALGGNMSQGTVSFVSFFEQLNDTADAFGDLGLSSQDMMNQYAEYLDYARMTGQMNRLLAQGGDALNNAFIELQIETAGLANVTALSRSEALRRQMDAMTDSRIALGLQQLEEAGLPGQAEVVRGITRNLGLVAPDSEILGRVLDSFSQAVAESLHTGDIENFNFATYLDANTRAALEATMPGMMENLNQAVRSGSMSAEEAGDMVFNALADMNMETISNAGALPGSVLAYITELQTAGMVFQRNFAGYIDMSPEERAALRAETEQRLAESGRSVRMMNDVTEDFLQLQDFMTLPLQGTYETFDWLTGLLESGAEEIQRFFGTGSGFGDYYGTGAARSGDFGDGFRGSSGTHPQTSTTPASTTPAPIGVTPGNHELDTGLDTGLVNSMTSAADELGITLNSTSGVRPMTSDGDDTAGSTSGRHTGGYAVDTQLIHDGRVLSVNNPEDLPLIQEFTQRFIDNALAAGHQPSVGWGGSYMGGTSGHFDIAAGHRNPSSREGSIIQPAYWGNGSVAAGADDWLREMWTEAYQNQRRLGGIVDRGLPYLVGDQLGLDSAELFVPDTSGTIVNNRDLNQLIRNLATGDLSDLTGGSSNSIISELQEEYSSLIESKTQVVNTMRALSNAVRLFNENKHRKARIDIINSV